MLQKRATDFNHTIVITVYEGSKFSAVYVVSVNRVNYIRPVAYGATCMLSVMGFLRTGLAIFHAFNQFLNTYQSKLLCLCFTFVWDWNCHEIKMNPFYISRTTGDSSTLHVLDLKPLIGLIALTRSQCFPGYVVSKPGDVTCTFYGSRVKVPYRHTESRLVITAGAPIGYGNAHSGATLKKAVHQASANLYTTTVLRVM